MAYNPAAYDSAYDTTAATPPPAVSGGRAPSSAIYSPIYLVDIYLPSGVRRVATRDLIARDGVLVVGGEYGGAQTGGGVLGPGGFATRPFGEGGFGE